MTRCAGELFKSRKQCATEALRRVSALYGSHKIPSGRPSTSIVLITFNVAASHIVSGFVVENPWWDWGSSVAPRALTFSNRACRFKRVEVEDHQLPCGTTARNIQTTAFDVRENIVKTAFTANFGRLQHFIRACS